MNINHILGNLIKNAVDSTYYHAYRRNELRKYSDPKYKGILDSVTLTEEQKAAVDRVFLENYGRKIPYIWHQYYTAFTGRFDPYYFPELLYIPEFERYMNIRGNYADVFADKNILPKMLSHAGVRTPESFFSCSAGMISDDTGRIYPHNSISDALDHLGEAFIKPTIDSSQGDKCAFVNFKNGLDEVSGKPIMALLESYGSDWVIQSRIKCHETICKLYPDSVNTFRVISYRCKDEIITVPAFMRLGRNGARIDNTHAGGLMIAIDDDGSLHPKAYTELGEAFDRHPDTGVFFAGYSIPKFAEVLEAAKRCHYSLPQLGVVNWDFTIDQNGKPVLVEANTRSGSIRGGQMLRGHGMFGEKTPEILRWMRFMRSIKSTERIKYSFGKMPE